ncbi:MAG: formate/nitrite transporter family protein [Clostridia bacterium]|nr:formate/nitrite transporter family protein [Clostridia bacterium]
MSYRSPSEIGQAVVNSGITKATTDLTTLSMLGFLAGGFIAIAAITSNTVANGLGSWAGPGAVRLLSGLAFSIGIVMVIIGGAELFTGNSLMIAALLDRRIRAGALLRNWIIVYLANLAGAVFVAWLYYGTGLWRTADGELSRALIETAHKKASLDIWQAFFRGVLCNWLVCMGIWMSYAADDVTGRIVPTAMAVSAFVMCGAEHSIANMFYMPMGFMLDSTPAAQAVSGMARNIVPVTLGNITGGGLLVAVAYWIAYIRRKSPAHDGVRA